MYFIYILVEKTVYKTTIKLLLNIAPYNRNELSFNVF